MIYPDAYYTEALDLAKRRGYIFGWWKGRSGTFILALPEGRTAVPPADVPEFLDFLIRR